MCPRFVLLVFGVRNAHAAFQLLLFHTLCAASIKCKQAGL
jgi:hypothetical protein